MIKYLRNFIFFLLLIGAKCQEEEEECDPVFYYDCYDDEIEVMPKNEECDPVFSNCEVDCQTINEIDNEIFAPNNRQAFSVCAPESGQSQKCSDYEYLGYKCANTWNCRNNTIITDGKGLIDVRTASPEEEENKCGVISGILDVTDKLCEKPEQVCCKRPNFKIKKCPDTPSENTNRLSSDYSQCGRNASGTLTFTGQDESFLAFDVQAQPGEFPHMCVIFREVQGYNQYVGGAALIARNKLLTVAHKFYQNNNEDVTKDIRDHLGSITVRCGEHNVKESNAAFPSQQSKVKEIIYHPDYDPKRIHYNMAIIVTEDNFVYDLHIGPVCLPSVGQNFDNEKDCWSSGFGKNEDSVIGFYSDSLKKVDMPIVPQDRCRRIFLDNGLKASRVHPSWICVGGVEGKDTCKGDGGSPHVCKINGDNRYILVGSVSHGVGCGSEIPSSYTNVAGSMCWIDWVMSTVPLSQYNVDDFEDTDVLGLRENDPLVQRKFGSKFASVNGLSLNDCREFRENNPQLYDDFDIGYDIVDERNNEFLE